MYGESSSELEYDNIEENKKPEIQKHNEENSLQK